MSGPKPKHDAYTGALRRLEDLEGVAADVRRLAGEIRERSGQSGGLETQVEWLTSRANRADELEQAIAFVGQRQGLVGDPDTIIMALAK